MGLSSDEMFELCSEVWDLLGERNFDKVNEMLALSPLGVTKADWERSYGLIRYTCRYRNQLSHWVASRDRMMALGQDEFEKDPRLFQGLEDDVLTDVEPDYMQAFDALTGQPTPERK
jgi:hypothetical protein